MQVNSAGRLTRLANQPRSRGARSTLQRAGGADCLLWLPCACFRRDLGDVSRTSSPLNVPILHSFGYREGQAAQRRALVFAVIIAESRDPHPGPHVTADPIVFERQRTSEVGHKQPVEEEL